MSNPNHGVNVSTRIKVSLKLHPDRVRGCDQVVKDAVSNFLVGNRLVAKAIDE